MNDPSGAEESPFLFAIKWSHFKSAEELLKLGADVNVQDPKGMTALHYMLRKSSDKKYFAMLLRHGARGDIKNNDGITAAELMRKKKDPQFQKMADQLRVGERCQQPNPNPLFRASREGGRDYFRIFFERDFCNLRVACRGERRYGKCNLEVAYGCEH